MLNNQQFQYPKTPDDPDVDDFVRGQFARVHEAFGSNDTRAVFGPDNSPVAPAPWPRAGRRKDIRDYDPEVVREALRSSEPLTEIDPRYLHSTQPNVTRQALSHYYPGKDSPYERTGETFADKGNAGNRFPVVYSREGVNMLLSGHHRATSALIEGRPLRARYVEGPWGPPRGQ